jgi:type II secretory pathway pseudopilin PulG
LLYNRLMIKSPSKQTGSAHFIIITVIILVILGALGFIFWNNFINKHQVATKAGSSSQDIKDSSEKARGTSDVQPYTLSAAVEGINSTLSKNVCSGEASVKQGDFIQVKDTDPFKYQGGKSLIDQQFNFAYVQYGCGSQGSVALMKRIDGNWKIISDDARIYPMCETVRNEKFPTAIVDKCYETNRSADPTDL